MKKVPTYTVLGFSLVELMIAVAIFAGISTIVLANHSRFNGSVLLGSLAYDIGLSVREAQVYGLSVRQYTGEFFIGYGVHFSGTDSYIFFTDQNANRAYDQGVDSIIRTYSLGRGHRILRFCGDGDCSDDSVSPLTHLDIVFFRPEPDAVMTSDQGGPYSQSTIIVSAPDGTERQVSVQSTGQISVTSI